MVSEIWTRSNTAAPPTQVVAAMDRLSIEKKSLGEISLAAGVTLRQAYVHWIERGYYFRAGFPKMAGSL